MRYLIITLLSLSFVHAADEPQVPEVLNAFAAFEKVVVEQHKKIDPIIKKAKDDALLKLEAAKKEAMKRGDLKGALMIEEAIAKLSGGNILAAIEENIKNNANILGGNVGIVGKWKVSWDPALMVYNANGTCQYKTITGKWIKNGNKFIVNWDNNHQHILESNSNNEFKISINGTKGYSMTRLP